MEIRVLGCSGGRTPEHELTSYLVDGTVLIDAGGASSSLDFYEQESVEDILVTHAHLDHILGIATIYENTRRSRIRPLDIYGTGPVINVLKEHLFIPELMPGYSEDIRELPGINFHQISIEVPFRVGQHEVEAFPVFHSPGSVAVRVSDEDHTFVFSGDTGRTDRLWRWLKKRGGADCLIAEVSFPNSMQQLADVSRHLSPKTLAESLEKADIGKDQKVHLVHLKPSFMEQLSKEIGDLSGYDLNILKKGERITLDKDYPPKVVQEELEERVSQRDVEFDSGEDLYEQRDKLALQFGVTAAPGEAIFDQGDNSKLMYIIQEGNVKIVRKAFGKKKLLASLGPGEFFGEMAMLNNKPRSAAAIADTEVRLLAFNKKQFEKLLLDNFGIGLRLIRTLAHRIQRADMMIENLLYIDPQSKVINTLIQAAYDEGIDTEEGQVVRITPEELSERSGVVISTLRDILTEMVSEKHILAKKGTIIIPDPARLNRLLKFLELKYEFS